MEIRAVEKIIRDNENLDYFYANIGNNFVQVPMAALFGAELPVNIIMPDDDLGEEEIEIGEFYACGVTGVYDQFIEGTLCHCGGRWYKTDLGWVYKEPYWYNDAFETVTLKKITGEDISFFTPVYIGSDGLAYKYTPIAGLQNKIIGITRSSALQGSEIIIVLDSGKVSGCAGLSKGEKYFANAVAALVTDAPTEGVSQQLGLAISETEFLVQIGVAIKITI